MQKESLAVFGGNGVDGRASGLEQLAGSAGSTAFQALFDLAPQILNRVAVRRIRRPIFPPRPGGRNRLPDARHLVRGPMVQDAHVVALQPRHQPLFHPG